MKHKSDKSNHQTDLSAALQESVKASRFDTAILQQRIITSTKDLPQLKPTVLKRIGCFLVGTTHGRLAAVACSGLLAVILLQPLPQSETQPSMTVIAAPADETDLFAPASVLIELDSGDDAPAELVWDEVLLLSDELAFASLQDPLKLEPGRKSSTPDNI